MENDGYGVYNAVCQNETAETPKDDAKDAAGKDSAVEEEDGELDRGDCWDVKEFDSEDILYDVLNFAILKIV